MLRSRGATSQAKYAHGQAEPVVLTPRLEQAVLPLHADAEALNIILPLPNCAAARDNSTKIRVRIAKERLIRANDRLNSARDQPILSRYAGCLTLHRDNRINHLDLIETILKWLVA